MSAFYPYRSEAARDRCFAYLQALAARRWPVVSEERVVPTTFGDTFVRITGPADAPPIVLLHGASGTSLMWAPNITALSVSYRTFAVDQVGDFGRSICAKPMRTMRDYMSWLIEFFDGLDLRRGINLVGMSYGGGLAAQFALHDPGRLQKLVLLAPGATVLHTSPRLLAHIFMAVLTRGKSVEKFLRWMFVDTALRDRGWLEYSTTLFRTNLENMQHRRTPFPPVLSDAQWRALRVPTLFLVGENEKIYSPEKAVRRLKRVAPSVTAEIVPGADHDVSEAQPEIVNRRILEFLSAPLRATASAA